jgi:geranylgeranyl pyrophosphate synthase
LINNWLQTQEFNEQKVSDFKTIFEESGAYKYTVAKRDAYYDKALDFLNKTSISETNKLQLTKFAQKATVRIQ